MYKVLLQLLLVCSSVLQNLTASAVMFEWKSDHTHENVTSDADRIRTVNGTSKLQCSLQCLDTTDCVAFFHSKSSRICHLQSSATLHVHQVTLTSSADTKFYTNVCMDHDFKYHADLRKYYAILWQPLTKSDAELQCKHHGGRLIRLDRKSELSAMKNILQAISTIDRDTEAFWVGAERNNDSGHFEWNNGEKVDSSFWEPGEPRYSAASKVLTTCVLMVPVLKYNLDDYECIPSSGLKIFPICECALP